MANYNRYRGSDYPNYGNREEDRDRYSRRDYNQYESDYGNTEDYGRRRDTGTGSYNSSNDSNRSRNRRYDEDWDDYNNRMSNYGNRSQGSNYGSNYGNSYGTSQYNRNRAYDEDYNEEYGTGSYGYGRQYDRDRDYRNRRENHGRDWWDKTKDEVSSWFGDEDAERRRRKDKIVNHRGRGPKGYIRSDERIREDVNDRLSDDAFLDASEIEVSVSGGEVTLTGTVENRIDKRRAEDLAEDVSGVNNVQNQLRVMQTTTTNVNGLKNEYQG